jgi:nickel transport system substrate-binding protein
LAEKYVDDPRRCPATSQPAEASGDSCSGSQAAAAGEARADAVFLVREGDPREVRCALEISRQLREAGILVEIEVESPDAHSERARAGEFDLSFAQSWGTPYDPHATLVAKFLPPSSARTALESHPIATSPALEEAIRASFGALGDGDRAAAYRAIQAVADEEAVVVPLYTPRWLALHDRRVRGFRAPSNAYGLDLSEVEFRR